jgi:predicted small integral membrane protein
MTRRRRGILVSIAVIAVVLIGLLAWYRIHFAMSPVEGFTVNETSSEQRVLIATQGSEFKDAIVTGIVERLRQRGLLIRVIDATALPDVNTSEWDAVVVLHTIEYGEAPGPVQAFVTRVGDPGKVVVLSTSGAGDFKIKGIDAISSASRMTDVPARVDELLGRIETVLAR